MSLNSISEAFTYATACYHKDGKGYDDLLGIKIPISTNYIKLNSPIDAGFIAIYPDQIVFSFQGTKNAKAWISDFDIYPLKDRELKNGEWGEGTIADGFYTGWSAFKKIVNEVIHKATKQQKANIICTGHSRGGALATLCGRHIAKNLKIPCSVISFASPAVGNKKYRNQFNKLPVNHTRVTYGYDIVSAVPPHALGFRHTGNNVHFVHKDWWVRLINRFRPSARFCDHHPKYCYQAIRTYLKKKGSLISLQFLDIYVGNKV